MPGAVPEAAVILVPTSHAAPAPLPQGAPDGPPDTRPGAGLRVALIGPVTPDLGGATPGGVATHQVHIARSLAAQGVALSLLATNAMASSPDDWQVAEGSIPLFRTYLPDGARAWLDPRYLRAVGPRALLRYAASLARRPDQVLGARRAALGQLLWYRRFLAVAQPHVIDVQHPLERARLAHLVRRLDGWRIPLVVTAHSFFGEHPDELIERYMAPNLALADRVIAVSRSTAEQAIRLGVEPDRVRVIRSGIDVERHRPRDRAEARSRLGLGPGLSLVLFVGNLEPRKAVDRLLVAIDRLRRSRPETVLAVVGTGESAGADDQGPRLRRRAAELGLGSAVRFTGRVSEDELELWHAAADVFALPSSSEAQGIAAMEAMACGLPVVVSAVGGLLDTVDDGRTGYLVPYGDVEGLADRLDRLLRDPARRAEMGAAGRASVVERFSWERSAAATVEVYREVLAA